MLINIIIGGGCAIICYNALNDHDNALAEWAFTRIYDGAPTSLPATGVAAALNSMLIMKQFDQLDAILEQETMEKARVASLMIE